MVQYIDTIKATAPDWDEGQDKKSKAKRGGMGPVFSCLAAVQDAQAKEEVRVPVRSPFS